MSAITAGLVQRTTAYYDFHISYIGFVYFRQVNGTFGQRTSAFSLKFRSLGMELSLLQAMIQWRSVCVCWGGLSWLIVSFLSGVPALFDRNKILSGGDLSHYQVPHCIRIFFYYTPRITKLLGGYTGFTPSVCPSVRLSVRPSVRPSVPHAVSALYHLQLWMDSFHIWHKWSLPWEGVLCTMTFDLDLYLQGHLALT